MSDINTKNVDQEKVSRKSLEERVNKRLNMGPLRISRRNFWKFFTRMFVVLLFAHIFLPLICYFSNSENFGIACLVIEWIIHFVVWLFILDKAELRLQDIGIDGGFVWVFCVCSFIPVIFVFSFLLFIIFMLLPGQAKANEYGPNPLEKVDNFTPATDGLNKTEKALIKIKNLKKQGYISEEEYERIYKKILNAK